MTANRYPQAMALRDLNSASLVRRSRAAVVLCALLFSTASAASTIYRWVDAQGRVHYGDATSAPQNAKAVPRPFGADVPEQGLTASAPTELPVADLQPRGVANCDQAQAQYDAYLNAAEIVETDSLGVERAITGAQREQLLARAELDVSRACADATATP